MPTRPASSITLNRRAFLLLGSVGLGLGLARPGLAGVSGGLQNIAARGQIHNGTAAASGTKTRFKGIYRFTIAAGGAVSLAPLFANVWINNAPDREVDGTAAYTIRKAAIAYEGRCVPLTFSGQRSVTVSPGQVDLQADVVRPEQFGVSSFLPGFVAFVRLSLDVPAGETVSAHANPMYLAGESLLRYDPLNDIDDIDDVTGWAEPAGSDQWVSFPGPIMVVGRPSVAVTSLIGLGDSILDGANDSAGDGSAGGGWLRRGAFAANLPYLSISRTGDKAQFLAASHRKTAQLLQYGHAAVVALGNNDIRDGRRYEALLADFRTIRGLLRDAGIQRVVQAQVLSETVSSDQTTSIAGQSVRDGFGTGSVRARLNAAIAAGDDDNIDDQIDIVSPVQSLDKWNVPRFSSQLASAAGAWGGAVILEAAPNVGDFLSFESETPDHQDAAWPHVTAISGNGPYVVHLNGGPTKAHGAGASVRSSWAADGIHPQQPAHKAMAIKAGPALRRAAAIKTPWIDPAKSIEIDFVNGRAQIQGTGVSVAACVSCTRGSAGMAFDGASWFEVGNDSLRSVDGGGLFVEPGRTNVIRNNMMAGRGSPSIKPDFWQVVAPAGVVVDRYDHGIENGIRYIDMRLLGSLATQDSFLIAADSDIATGAGQTWSHSAFMAILQNAGAEPTSITIGGWAGNIAGTEVEAHISGDLRSLLSRAMSRQSLTFTLMSDTIFSVTPRIGIRFAGGSHIDLSLRIGLPQLEEGVSASSPIATSGSAATRLADQVALALPAGQHDLVLRYDNGSTQTISSASGYFRLPPELDRPVIHAISGTRTA